MIHNIFTGPFNYRIVAVILLVSGITGCKSSDNLQTSQPTAKESELEELYWNRINSSRSSFTEADVKFMTGMIAHHAQALIMSRLAPNNGASATIQTLTKRIINAQKDEIATMQQWLRDREQPVPEIQFDGLQLRITLGGKPYTSFRKMRGVLSQKKMQELAEAKGDDFDRLFLTYMIEHHAGAVFMVEKLFNTDGAAQDKAAFRLASDIQVDQRTEIDRMRLMLDNMANSD